MTFYWVSINTWQGWILAQWGMNTCMPRYEYLNDEEAESTSSWISFNRENYVENICGFRFANSSRIVRNID